MEFNWSTFFLEIINFLVLVWLIKRFFYKPVREIIEKRRSAIDEQIASAKTLESDAERMRTQYENRLSAWEKEKQQQQEKLNKEIEEQKKQQLDLLEKQLVEEKQKNASIQHKQTQILKHKIEKQALDQAVHFTAKLLQDLSCQELENKLIELFLKNVDNFSQAEKQILADVYSDENPAILIETAYPLSLVNKDNIQKAIQNLFEQEIHCSYNESHEVIAGLRVNIGSYVLHANLADELKFFSDSANGR